MKKLLVMSDTHGNIKCIDKIKEEIKSADYVIHLGDHYYDIKPYLEEYGNKIYTVFGNCDGGGEDYILEVNGAKILLTHGDRYHVKSSLFRLMMEAREIGASAVLYGHTHVAKIEEDSGVLYINPGCMTRFSKYKSYAIVEIDETGRVSARLKEIENEDI